MSLIVRALLSVTLTALAFVGVASEASSVRQTMPSVKRAPPVRAPVDTMQVAIECVCPSAT